MTKIERVKIESINKIEYRFGIKRDDLETIKNYIELDRYNTREKANVVCDFLEELFGLNTKAKLIFVDTLEENNLDQAIKEIEQKFDIKII